MEQAFGTGALRLVVTGDGGAAAEPGTVTLAVVRADGSSGPVGGHVFLSAADARALAGELRADGSGLGVSELPAVRRALGELPYSGAMIGYDGLRLVEWLARYGGVLQGEAERAAAQEAELRELRRDVAGLRRLLGVGGAS